MSASGPRRYRSEHRTTYRYTAPVTLSLQQLHLTPRPLDYQRRQAHEITVTPAPTDCRERTDSFGNPVIEMVLESPHDSLEVVALSTVEVCGRTVPKPDATPAWEAVREALAYRAGWRPEPAIMEATQFLFESPHVRVKRDLRAYASECFAPGRALVAAAEALMAKIHREFNFDAAATTVATPVMKFFEQRRGVCQDFAHLMISCLRSMGLAARYVSGYLLTRPPPGKPRRVGADASHGWVALFVPGSGWIDLDPTNNVFPSLEHITLGWGRDFTDVTPLCGVIHGGGDQTLEVKVTIEPDDATTS
jgi:transglutaminase-like putative cysteine protease